MTFLPIVTRELRVASRRRGTYWSRSLTAVAAVIVAGIVYFAVRDTAPQSAGQTLFGYVSGLAFFYCVVVGIRSTADCLSEEKRDGTLGLLFLTDLRGYDVVGGKLVATSLNAFYGLTAIFPVMAIPLLMGGITNGEFWRVAMVLANTFFLSLAVGMFMSSVCISPRKAMAFTFIVLLLITLGTPLLGELIPYLRRAQNYKSLALLLNPITPFTCAMDADYAKQSRQFWESSATLHGCGWLCLAVASFIVPRSWQDKTPGARVRRVREFWHRWSFGDPAERLAFRRRLLNTNAFYWLAGRARLKPVHVWVALAGLAALWAWGAWAQGRDWVSEMVYVATAIILNSMLKFWVASEAGRRLGEDRKMGSLELILSTPLTVRDILHGQFLALRRQFLGPLLAVLVIEFVFLFASLQQHRSEADFATSFVTCWLAGMVMLVADLLALTAVGMWVSLTARNPNRATGITVTRVLVLPVALGVAFLILTAIFSFAAQAEPGWKFFLALWFIPGIVADVAFGLTAWRRLHTEFRDIAAQRYAQRESLLRRLFGRRPEPVPGVPSPPTVEAA